MGDVRLRPRFERDMPCDPRDVLAAVRRLIEDEGQSVVGRVYDCSALLRVPPDEQLFWSPQLQLSVEPGGNGGSSVHGIFGPHPTVWSLFIAVYVAMGFAGSMGLMFGFAQWILGNTPTALWVAPAAALLAAAAYGIGRTGRHLAREQTRALFDTVTAILDACEADQPS